MGTIYVCYTSFAGVYSTSLFLLLYSGLHVDAAAAAPMIFKVTALGPWESLARSGNEGGHHRERAYEGRSLAAYDS